VATVGTASASLVFAAQAPTVNLTQPVLTGTATFRFIAIAPDFYESALTTGSAILVLTASAPGSATITLPPMDGEVPTGQSFQGDSTFETYKRRTFNA